MKRLNILDGTEEYLLNEKITLRLNLTDPNLLESLNEAMGKLEEIQGGLKELKEDEVFAAAAEADRQERAILDELFYKGFCTDLFGLSNLSASAGGFPLWANLLLALSDEARSALAGELKERDKRIAKYTAKYRRGKK